MNTIPNTQAAILVFSLLFSAGANALLQRDYRCKIDRVATADTQPNTLLEFQQKNYIGKEFTVERRTGIMSGSLKNAYVTRPEVIDSGSSGNSYKVVNTLRLEQGAGRGSHIYMLVIKEYIKEAEKPFLFAENDEIYFGKCIHF